MNQNDIERNDVPRDFYLGGWRFVKVWLAMLKKGNLKRLLSITIKFLAAFGIVNCKVARGPYR